MDHIIIEWDHLLPVCVSVFWFLRNLQWAQSSHMFSLTNNNKTINVKRFLISTGVWDLPGPSDPCGLVIIVLFHLPRINQGSFVYDANNGKSIKPFTIHHWEISKIQKSKGSLFIWHTNIFSIIAYNSSFYIVVSKQVIPYMQKHYSDTYRIYY